MKLIILLIIFLVFPSCNKNNEQVKKNIKQNVQVEQQYIDENDSNKYIQNENAKKIANNILKSQTIDKVIIVLNNNKALVGLEIRNNENKDKNYYRKIVIREVQKVDPNILDIMVTTDKNMYERIKKLNNDIENERPLSGIINNFIKTFDKK